MDPEAKGAHTEARCLSALKVLVDMYPRTIVSVRQSSPEVDARGIDFLVKVRLPHAQEKRTMTVPLEVKSSKHGVAKWRVVHADLAEAGVLIVYLPLKMSDRKIRRLLYRALDRTRHNSRNGTLYHSLFQRLFIGGSKRLFLIIALIREKRSQGR